MTSFPILDGNKFQRKEEEKEKKEKKECRSRAIFCLKSVLRVPR